MPLSVLHLLFEAGNIIVQEGYAGSWFLHLRIHLFYHHLYFTYGTVLYVVRKVRALVFVVDDAAKYVRYRYR